MYIYSYIQERITGRGGRGALFALLLYYPIDCAGSFRSALPDKLRLASKCAYAETVRQPGTFTWDTWPRRLRILTAIAISLVWAQTLAVVYLAQVSYMFLKCKTKFLWDQGCDILASFPGSFSSVNALNMDLWPHRNSWGRAWEILAHKGRLWHQRRHVRADMFFCFSNIM